MYITAFGETKTIKEWSKDKRCVVKYYALYKRFKAGWETEKAITYIVPQLRDNYLNNRKFGKLTVVKFTGKRTIKNEKIWLCNCECGNTKEVQTGRLVNGNTSSCGCYRKELGRERFKKNYLGYGIAAQNALFGAYVGEARRRKLKWELTKEEFLVMSKQNCFYCECEPSKIITKGSTDEYIYNGIDRVDSNFGYLKNNIVTCCEQCNTMKFDYTTEEFLNKVKLIHDKHF